MKIANYNEHNFIVQDDDIWATQGQLGKLYGVAEHTVNYHLKNIFESNELDKNSVYREIRYTATDGVVPSKKEANIGKNYLTQNELYRMYLLSGQFLNFAESIALTNKQLHQKLDDMLVLNEMPVFDGYTDRGIGRLWSGGDGQ